MSFVRGMIVKSKQAIAVGLVIGLWAVTYRCLADESGADVAVGLRLTQQTIIDPEEVEGSFEDRVRVMQEWLRQREDQRRHENWGRDVVSPQEPSRSRSSSSRYFEEHGYDERGFRRMEGNIRVRLRGLDDESASRPDAGGTDRGGSSASEASSRGRSSVKSQRGSARPKGTIRKPSRAKPRTRRR